MADSERLTITLASDMAALIQDAVDGGDYASSDEVVQAALRDWEIKRVALSQDLASLRADIGAGLADLAEGRVEDFEASRIIERGKRRSAKRSPSG